MMRPPIPDWFWLLVLTVGTPIMVQFIRDGIGRELSGAGGNGGVIQTQRG